MDPPPPVPAAWIHNIPTRSAQQQAVAEDIAVNSFRASSSADRTIFVIRAFRLFGNSRGLIGRPRIGTLGDNLASLSFAPPNIFERLRRHRGVTHCVCDAGVAKEVLQASGVHAQKQLRSTLFAKIRQKQKSRARRFSLEINNSANAGSALPCPQRSVSRRTWSINWFNPCQE